MIFKLNFVSKTLVKPKFIFVNIFNYFTFVNKSVGFSFTSIVKPLRNICDFSNFLHLIFYKCFVFFLDYGYPGQRVCPKIKISKFRAVGKPFLTQFINVLSIKLLKSSKSWNGCLFNWCKYRFQCG